MSNMDNWVPPEKFVPHPYQVDAIKHGLSVAGGGLFLPPGLGKTSSVLMIIKLLFSKQLTKGVLIVAPLRVIKFTWPPEVAKWEDFEHFKLVTLHGAKKEEAFKEKADIYLINFEGLLFLLPKLAKLHPSKWPFDMLVIDESTKLKAYDSKRFKLLKPLLGKFRRRLIMTGTPTPNSMMDIFAQAMIMDCGKALTQFITHFRNEFFFLDMSKSKPGEPPNAWDYKIQPGAADRINDRIRHLVYSSNGAGFIKDQTPIFNDVFVDLPPAARAQYKTMEKVLFSQLESGIILAANAAVASGKCIAEGTEVLTDSGWVAIESLDNSFRVWDGCGWVSIDGLQYNGYKQVVTCWGVRMTPDHKVLTATGWATAKDILDGEPYKRYDRPSIRLPHSHRSSVYTETHRNFSASCLVRTMSMWQYYRNTRGKLTSQRARKGSLLRLQAWRDTSSCSTAAWLVWQRLLGSLVSSKRALYESIKQRLGKLRRKGHYFFRDMAAIRELLGRYGAYVQRWLDARQDRRKWPIFSGELQMGYCNAAGQKQTYKRYYRNPTGAYDCSGGSGSLWRRLPNTVQTLKMGLGDFSCADTTKKVKVFDVLNAGPNERFLVRSNGGELTLVHNCRQIANGHLYTDDKQSYEELHSEKLDAMDDLIEELSGNPCLVWYEFKSDLARLRAKFPGEVLTAKSPDDVVERWNRGETSILYVHWQSAAHGLNLQFGGFNMIYFCVPWSGEGYSQGIARLARQGQKHQVIVHRILARRTIDELIVKTLAKREATQEDFLKELREYWIANKSNT